MTGEQQDHSWIEEIFETGLFNARFLVLLAVLGTLASSIVMYFKGCVEVIVGWRAFVEGFTGLQSTAIEDKSIILSFIPAVDDYLFATILLIIAMGLYELFISEIDPKSRKGKTRPTWLRVDDLDDLTSHIGEVVITTLIVTFFRLSFSINYRSPLDLLMLGGGVLLISASLVVAHQVSTKRKGNSRKSAEHDG